MNDNNPNQKPIIAISKRLRFVLDQLEHVSVFEQHDDTTINDKNTLQGDR